MFGFGQNLVISGIFIKCTSATDFMVSLIYLLCAYSLILDWVFKFVEKAKHQLKPRLFTCILRNMYHTCMLL